MIQEGDGIRGLEIKNRASVLGKQRGDWWGRVWAQEGRAVDETSVIRKAGLRRPRTLC